MTKSEPMKGKEMPGRQLSLFNNYYVLLCSRHCPKCKEYTTREIFLKEKENRSLCEEKQKISKINHNVCVGYLVVVVSETEASKTGRGEEDEEVVLGSPCHSGVWEGLRLLHRDPGNTGGLWAEAHRDSTSVLAGSLSRPFEGQTERK